MVDVWPARVLITYQTSSTREGCDDAADAAPPDGFWQEQVQDVCMGHSQSPVSVLCPLPLRSPPYLRDLVLAPRLDHLDLAIKADPRLRDEMPLELYATHATRTGKLMSGLDGQDRSLVERV